MENTREQEERRIAEDFRRQLQERALGGRAIPALAELLRWLDQNPELLEYVANTSWGAVPGLLAVNSMLIPARRIATVRAR